MPNFNTVQSFQGPTDATFKHTTTDGYQPVSRIGEVVLNSFIDTHEFAQLKPAIKYSEVVGLEEEEDADGQEGEQYETRPHFHECVAPLHHRAHALPSRTLTVPPIAVRWRRWATALPGMIAVSRKARNSTFRNYIAAETSAPVITCCGCKARAEEMNYFFSGIVRSASTPPPDDNRGPSIDEHFTLAIGGMATLLNNSKDNLFPGDMLEWTFFSENNTAKDGRAKRGKSDPRRIGVKLATGVSPRVIGRCLSFAKPLETFDLLIKGC